ncbi:Ig-like domain-containing protein, partial [Staphylococcus hominis]
NIVANGKYDVNNKVVTYTFTDYVNERENIKGNIQLPIFTDRKNTPNSGYYNNTFDVAGEKYETNFDIQYSSPVQGLTDVNGPSISSF